MAKTVRELIAAAKPKVKHSGQSDCGSCHPQIVNRASLFFAWPAMQAVATGQAVAAVFVLHQLGVWVKGCRPQWAVADFLPQSSIPLTV
jgi:hypothetical protein